MKLRAKIGMTFGMAAVGVLLMATVAFACVPGYSGGRACGVCGGFVGVAQFGTDASTGDSDALPATSTDRDQRGMVLALTALGAAGFALFLSGVVVLARDPRRDPVGVTVRTA